MWSIWTLLGVVGMQAVGMYFELREQRKDQSNSSIVFNEKLEGIRKSQESTNTQIIELAKQMGGKDLKDTEHDLKLQDLERRISSLELHARPAR